MKKIFITISLIVSLIWDSYAYDLTSKDQVTINKIVNNISKESNDFWFSYRDNFINNLNFILRKSDEKSQSFSILNQILTQVKKINFKDYSNNYYENNKLDINKLKQSWLDWHNQARNNLWLSNYSYDTRLNSTAFEWSYNMNEKWSMDHKRYSYSWYYDYNDIEKWFNEKWVNCKVVNRATSSESIWYFSYYCKKDDSDCSDEALESMKAIFDMYMAEKWLQYPANAHYRAITLTNFRKIWLWITIKKEENPYWQINNYDYYKLYLTSHYCTEFIN